MEAHCIRFSKDSNDLLAIGTSAGTIEVGRQPSFLFNRLGFYKSCKICQPKALCKFQLGNAMQVYNTKTGRFSYKLDVGRKGMRKYTCTSMSFRPARFAKVTENVLVSCGTANQIYLSDKLILVAVLPDVVKKIQRRI